MVGWSRLLALGLGLGMVIISNVASNASGCLDTTDRHVILASDAIDPNVFIWDRRSLMVSYAAGFWRPTSLIIDHTLLEKPGTRAFVIACQPHQLRVRYTTLTRDAIGLKLLSGPDTGRYGWAIEDDVHIIR